VVHKDRALKRAGQAGHLPDPGRGLTVQIKPQEDAPMNISMRGKVALVTGGSSGIGRATAVAFAHEGAVVVIASRHQAPADETLRVIRREGGSALWVEADVSQATRP
jgi:3-oxoacyl-ACP reductase-like protein